jgi:hypothetical protein
VTLSAHALQAVQFRSKSVSNEGHFALVAETVSRPYLPLHCSGVTETCEISLPAHALQAVQVRLKSVSNEGHFILESETRFRPYLPSHCSGVNEIVRHVAISAHARDAVQVR